MNNAELLVEAFGRVQSLCHRALADADQELLAGRIDAEANSIAWLVWHLSRIQDDHVADASGAKQRWSDDGWFDRFGLPFGVESTGYGHGIDDVAALGRVPADLLLGYHDAVIRATVSFVSKLSDPDLDRIVDEQRDPPVTLGVRLVSVLSDNLQHAGQAGYVRGVLSRR